MNNTLDIYRKAYKLAIDLHIVVDTESRSFKEEDKIMLRSSARGILANIAEAEGTKIYKVRRFFYFKALDLTRVVLVDLDYLSDVGKLPSEKCEVLSTGYDGLAKSLHEATIKILQETK